METDITADGGTCLLRTNPLLFCRGICERLPFVLISLARPRILNEPKHVFLPRNGTNNHDQPRSVPFGPTASTIKVYVHLHQTRLSLCPFGRAARSSQSRKRELKHIFPLFFFFLGLHGICSISVSSWYQLIWQNSIPFGSSSAL